MPIKINSTKCCWQTGQCRSCSCDKVCVGCVEACPVDAITRDKLVEIDKNKCIECGACVSACKHKALSLI